MRNQVSFTVAPGEMVAVLGPSGASKTTISQLVSRCKFYGGASCIAVFAAYAVWYTRRR